MERIICLLFVFSMSCSTIEKKDSAEDIDLDNPCEHYQDIDECYLDLYKCEHMDCFNDI